MKKILSILRLIWLPLVIIFIDVFFGGLPVLSILVALAIIFYMIPKTLLSIKKKDKFRANLTHTLIYIAMVILVLSAVWLDAKIAANRAQKMVDIIEQYNLKYNHYPDRLGELVPEFIANIPSPKLFLLGSEFSYYVYEEEATHKKTHELVYVIVPPFGRRGYLFERKNWHEFD